MIRNVHVVVPLASVVGVALLFLVTSSFVAVRQQQLTTHNSMTAVPRRRFSTSDDMRYILYGVGDQYTPYDQQLISYIRSHISQPSLTQPRRLTNTKKDASQVGQSKFVDKFLSGRRDGFFIECGAADGETYSNSLFFELERNWTGLLIEANSNYHQTLLDKNRRAYVLQTCLSTERRPATVRMLPAGVLGGIADKIHPSHLAFIGASREPEVAINCFPLNSIAAALDVSHVDYLSLDVEGPEVEILSTVDWTRLHIDIITVEYRIYGGHKIGVKKAATLQKLKELRELFRNTSIYREVGVIPNGSDVGGLDVVFSRI